MADSEWLASRFEEQRPRLRAVAYRMLGSFADADDAVQNAWERASRAGADDIENLSGWLTTIVARVCLNMLRTRNTRREESLEARVPDPVVSPGEGLDPEQEALLADAVGLALQVVISALAPAERLAFVLHDLFDVPFAEIGSLTGRTPQAARQLASRARRRVRDAGNPAPERDLAVQRAVVEAFFAAGRSGDFDALLAVLDPDVVLRADFGPGAAARSAVFRGAHAVASQARMGSSSVARVHLVLVNGVPGAVVTVHGKPFALMAFTVSAGRIVEIDAIGDRDRVARLAGHILAGSG